MSVRYQLERRRKPRIRGPISATAQGLDCCGSRFEIETILDNLSAGGLYLRLSRPVEKAAELSFVFRLPPGTGADDPEIRFRTSGIVRRVEPLPDHAYGLGIEIMRHRQIEMTFERLNAVVGAQVRPARCDSRC